MRSGFLTGGTTVILTGKFVVVRGCPVHGGMLSNTRNFYPQNIHSTPPVQILPLPYVP